MLKRHVFNPCHPAGSLAKCREMRIIRAIRDAGKTTAWWDILTSILGKGRLITVEEKEQYGVALDDLKTNNIIHFNIAQDGYYFTAKGRDFVDQLKDNGVDLSEF